MQSTRLCPEASETRRVRVRPIRLSCTFLASTTGAELAMLAYMWFAEVMTQRVNVSDLKAKLNGDLA